MPHHPPVPSVPSDAWLTLPLALSPLAERLTGADRQPMVYLGGDDRYLRLSPGAASLLDALDGQTTAAQILQRIDAGGDPLRAERRRRSVLETIDALRTAGAFTLSRGGGAARGGRWRRWLIRTPRLCVRGGIDTAVAGPVAVAAGHRRIARAGLVALAVASTVLLIAGVSQFPNGIQIAWPLVAAVLLGEVVLHELAHAAACRAYGVRIREAGIMLWAWFLPLAYVDCTDIYRLPARRPRIMVALAGPWVDLVAAGACSAVALATRGEVSGTAFVILLSLVLVLVRNLTPLLPTDGYLALEAATGELNLRHRAWAALRASVRRQLVRRGRPGASTGVDRPARTRRQTAYVTYGVVSVLYAAAMFAFFVVELHATVRLLG